MRSRPMTLTVSALVLAPGLALTPPGASFAFSEAPSAAQPAAGLVQAVPGLPKADGVVGERRIPFTAAAGAQATGGALSGGVAAAARAKKVIATTATVAISRELAVVGASWAKDSAPGAVLQYRLESNGKWGAWETSDSDPAIDESSRKGARDGSDAIPVTGASRIQARLVGTTASPKDARLSILSPSASGDDASAVAAASSGRVAAAGLRSAAGMSGGAAVAAVMPSRDADFPPIRSRGMWKANEKITKKTEEMEDPIGFTIHHTAGTNAYTQSQVPRILRGIQQFHVRDRGWSDIGYNYLVDKWGGIWEGRKGSFDGTPRGAHTARMNDQLVGISLIGDYQKVRPSAAAVERIAKIVAWKSRVIDVDPTGTMELNDRERPVVVGHRDVNPTTCPGRYLYAKLPTIRERAAELRED
ncbi:MAG: N-acetylmuramoyl-L-alanine amidase [Dermatophilus congolensis]|nr:N-acetylmuramoyl-L-alanine amidase [Dermatophilus congolensis]